ncbi:methyltransferase-like protein 27 [Perca flavescens]|uniref:methyltransferase-like protein 27 n=1 Tax=Perca flavescens TaxID=8167 RepID=UPI00106E4DD1|nr:methyltransferase-like protein 27 [Perca flavescens]XP_028437475.1 methyltransferase-like protein 27 [Perca flavescens]XP_028437476.1 methyltransferase-like protein 27 [Perca flavescens]
MSDGSRTVNDVKTFLKSYRDVERMKFYDQWAETYDQDCNLMGYRAPHQTVDFLNANFSGSPEEVLVLDVACGSGLVAKLMAELGFRNFVGVDGSKGMLEQAAKTGLYQDLRLALLGTEPLPAQTDAFDVVMIVGALRDSFVPVSVVRELCCAAKPGGYVCMSRVDPKLESGDKYKVCLEKELQLMEDEGLWTRVISQEMDRYMMDVYYDDQYLYGTMYLYRKSLN